MKSSRITRVIAGAALGLMLLFSGGSFLATTAQGQDRDRNWQRDRGDRRDDRSQRRDRDRDDWNRRDRERAREIERARRYGYYRSNPYGGYGGGYGRGGYSNSEVQKGFRDGLDRGQEDVRSRRSPNPNNSSHYRSGNEWYREGFRRGYEQGYRQYGGYRGW